MYRLLIIAAMIGVPIAPVIFFGWRVYTATLEATAQPWLAVPAAIAEAFPGQVLEISPEEKAAFAGNCLALTLDDLFFSATAWRALAREKRDRLRDWGFRIHTVELDEVEKAGGSLRCCIAELF